MSFDLKRERLNAGLSIKALARELEVHEHSIRKLEAGGVTHPETAKKVADHFGVTVVDVMPAALEAAGS